MSVMSSEWMRYSTAQALFDARDYRGAATLLTEIIEQAAGDLEVRHGLADARLLLARAYFHSAQLSGAEEQARLLLADDPADGYAALLLGRTLQRAGRPDEASPLLKRAEALGYGA